MEREALDTLIERLPVELRQEVYDYASYLLERKAPNAGRARRANLHRGAAQMRDDFDAPLPEGFWLDG